MNLHRALFCSLACAALAVAAGCETYHQDGPKYMGSRSDRQMSHSIWQVSGEAKPEVPMPAAEPKPEAPKPAVEAMPVPSGQNK